MLYKQTSNSNMKVIHISDLHISAGNYDDSLDRVYYLFKHISNLEFDHLIITGDVTESGLAQEYNIFRELMKMFGLLDPERATVIIGNHDIFGGVQRPEDILLIPEKWSEVDYDEKINLFHHYSKELLDNDLRMEDNIYPFIKKRGIYTIIGLNTTDRYSVMKNPFASNGFVDEGQLKRLEALLEQTEINGPCIFAVHHHFNKIRPDSDYFLQNIWLRIERQTMKLRKKKKLFDVFSKLPVAAVLHGHYHVSEAYDRKGVLFLNAGASVKNNSSSMNYFSIDLKHDSLRFKLNSVSFPKRARLVNLATFEEQAETVLSN